MIKIDQIKLPILPEKGESFYKDGKGRKRQLEKKIIKHLHIKPEELVETEIIKHSVDARKKELFDVFQVVVNVKPETEKKLLKNWEKRPLSNTGYYEPVIYDVLRKKKLYSGTRKKLEHSPVIIGAGPAGYFCGLMLAEQGYRPIIIERGKPVEARTEDVHAFWETGVLNTASNVQFGEGGAGAFSDGKLNTLVKDKDGRSREVLKRFVKYGADESVLYENKPHVGTDYLYRILIAMRKDFLEMGGEIRFESTVTGFETEGDRLKGVRINEGELLPAEVCVLAIGHSARDTFRVLEQKGISMMAKSFAVGFRVEHPQTFVNRHQYGIDKQQLLPAAPYKVTAQTESGRGVYSFCMCPGGYVVNASSEEGRLAVNGMSYFNRDGKNANSAIIVSVTPEDYGSKSPLAGVVFQEALEERAYQAGNGSIPQQLFGDFEKNQSSKAYGDFESEVKGKACLTNLRGILPNEVGNAFVEGMHLIGKRIAGFDRQDAILSGVESRTSSPVRITRDEEMESNVRGLYPCGEGAGYAGGIMSAAMDGMKVAEMILAVYDK